MAKTGLQLDTQNALLGFDELDSSLLRLLGDSGTLSVAEMTRKAKHPRSSIVDSLARLHRRGWVRKARVGVRTHWKLGNIVAIREQAHAFISLLRNASSHEDEGIVHVPISADTEFSVHSGIASILQLYRTTVRVHASKRMRVIQSTESAKALFARVKVADLISVNEAIKRHSMIVDAIVTPSILALSTDQSREWKASMEGRTAATVLVPDNILPFAAEMLIFDDVALMTNWREETCILVRNQDLVEMLKALHSSLRLLGDTFDPNAFIRGSLVEKL